MLNASLKIDNSISSSPKETLWITANMKITVSTV